MRLTNSSSFQPTPSAAVLSSSAQADTHTQRQRQEYSHVHMRRLEPALIDVVVCERLRRVGAVLVHRDGNFALWRNSMSHPSSLWTWAAHSFPRPGAGLGIVFPAAPDAKQLLINSTGLCPERKTAHPAVNSKEMETYTDIPLYPLLISIQTYFSLFLMNPPPNSLSIAIHNFFNYLI